MRSIEQEDIIFKDWNNEDAPTLIKKPKKKKKQISWYCYYEWWKSKQPYHIYFFPILHTEGWFKV